MYTYVIPWLWLIQLDLEPTAKTPNKTSNTIRIEIPEKLIRFLLYFVVLKANVVIGRIWGLSGILSWRNSAKFIISIDTTSFISGILSVGFIPMALSGVFLFGVCVILDLGISLVIFLLMYFFQKNIGKLIKIKLKQMILTIPSFLEIKTF